VLLPVFPDSVKAQEILLKGDDYVPVDPQDPTKRLYFLVQFLPFLRQQLDRRFVVATLSGAAGLPNDVTDALLTEVLVVEANQHTIDALVKLKEVPNGSGAVWKGYLMPSAEDGYTFVIEGGKQPSALSLDGVHYEFKQNEDYEVWCTDPVKLKSNKLCWLEVDDRADELQWKTRTSLATPIPASALLPDYCTKGAQVAFIKLYKAALLVNGFGLSAEEISYWQEHGSDFGPDGNPFDFNGISFEHWKRLQAYAALRNSLPKTETTLLDLFKWAGQSDASEILHKNR